MIVSIIILLFSFFFEGFISNYLNLSLLDSNYYSTLYTLISFIIIYPYFNNDKKYIVLLIIIGILFDIVYTNTFLLNVVLFICIYIINKFLDLYLPSNILTTNLKSIISIFLYNILTYIVIVFTNYNNYLFSVLINICLKGIPITIIYTSIMYLIINFIYKKNDIRVK